MFQIDYGYYSGTAITSYDQHASDSLGGDYWRVMHAFSFTFKRGKHSYSVDIPAGYLTDGASVPRLLQNIIPKWGRHGNAVVVHDLLCERLTIMRDGVLVKITRKQADDILYHAMGVSGVNIMRRVGIRLGVGLYRYISLQHFHNTPTENRLKRKLEDTWSEVII